MHNLIFVFADQWRAQATGYAGDPNVRTPHLDRFAAQSLNAVNAVACCPVCSPYRACLLTGRYPLTHRIIVNDQLLSGEFVSFAQALGAAGCDTAYIGKWHLHGGGRTNFIPREHRLGFRFWKALECTHDYNNSCYYGDTDEKLVWEGYDALAQTREACRYIREERDPRRPFALFLSWGPPHNPFETAPEQYRRMYEPGKLALRPNVPPEAQDRARRELAGYYAHCSALDDCFAMLLKQIEDSGLAGSTVVVFTSDHGDLLGSQGVYRKQHPYDESILAPFLARVPGAAPRVMTTPLNAPDLMPTLLKLCGVPVPPTVEGEDLSAILLGRRPDQDRAALIACYKPFHEWRNGREYRGVRTARYTYVRDLNGPWLMFDNLGDPYQLRNLVDSAEAADLRRELERKLNDQLQAARDEFLPGAEYMRRFGIRLNEKGDVYVQM